MFNELTGLTAFLCESIMMARLRAKTLERSKRDLNRDLFVAGISLYWRLTGDENGQNESCFNVCRCTFEASR